MLHSFADRAFVVVGYVSHNCNGPIDVVLSVSEMGMQLVLMCLVSSGSAPVQWSTCFWANNAQLGGAS